MSLALITGSSNPHLAKVVSEQLKIPLVKTSVHPFADKETHVQICESLRGRNVFILQSTCSPANNNYMELFLFLDAARRASAQSITVIMPYFGYARQDRKDSARSPISAALMASFCHHAGAARLVVMDLHSPQIQGFFLGPVDNLYGHPSLTAACCQKHKWDSKDLVVVSPDAGGMERAMHVGRKMKSSLALIHKQRSGPNKVKSMEIIGDVQGKVAILVDDMIDTAGTLVKAAEELTTHGASKVLAMATHPVLSQPAIERIENSCIEEVWVTNTIPLNPEAERCKKLNVVCIGNTLANSIQRIHDCKSVSSMFE